jgi:carbonic anhydrase/acetyltransferase-like protein (isoleucine patch superfamily)
MALIKSVRGFTPKFGKNCYLADNATIIGDVVMGDDCSIWFNAVLRGAGSLFIGREGRCYRHTPVLASVSIAVPDV